MRISEVQSSNIVHCNDNAQILTAQSECKTESSLTYSKQPEFPRPGRSEYRATRKGEHQNMCSFVSRDSTLVKGTEEERFAGIRTLMLATGFICAIRLKRAQTSPGRVAGLEGLLGVLPVLLGTRNLTGQMLELLPRIRGVGISSY